MDIYQNPLRSTATLPQPANMVLQTADRFTFEELTEAYNQTRVDYLVPMPMNVTRLKEYVRLYDVRLPCSCVAINSTTMLGLGMLGVRRKRGWITRLGVLPSGRRQGTATAIMDALLNQAQGQQLNEVWLEVIRGNQPAHELFKKLGFVEIRELIVARRPPNPNQTNPCNSQVARVLALNHDKAIALLAQRSRRANWLNETETMQNAFNLSALVVELKDGSQGWVTYHADLLQLTHIVVEVVEGDPQAVTTAVLHTLHERHSRQDAKAENLPEDAQWLGYRQAGYFEAFRRLEMVKPFTLKPGKL